MAKCLKESSSMASGPVLIFDKSSLESLNLDEAVLLDNFYRSNITPLFFVECLADLEKSIRSKSTPEQLVASLAIRTPEMNASSNVFHMKALAGELGRRHDLSNQRGRPMLDGGKAVQLGRMMSHATASLSNGCRNIMISCYCFGRRWKRWQHAWKG
jgi:hypothetical protein